MKRALSVTIAGIIVFLGSLVTGLLACSTLLLLNVPATMPPGSPLSQRAVALMSFLFWSCLSALGLSTGIGIFQRWRWARYSMISFGSVLVFVGLISIPFMIALPRFVPESSATPPEIMRAVSIGLGGFYLLLAILGAWFIYLFSRRHVADYFLGDAVVESPRKPKRPVPITIVAALMLVGLFSFPLIFTSSMPLFFMGNMLHGATARIIFLAWMLAYFLVGVALLRFKPWAWTAAMGIFIFGMLNQLLIFLPGRLALFQQEVLKSVAPYQNIPDLAWMSARLGMIIGVAAILVPVVLLIVSRAKYYAACSESERLRTVPSE